MGFKSVSSSRTGATSAVSKSSAVVNTGTGNLSVSGAAIQDGTRISLGVVTPGQTSANSAVSSASSGPSITSFVYLDANNNPSSANAVSTSGGNIAINGSNFVANSSVYINNTLVTNTFVSTTQIRAVCPAASAGNVSLFIFSPTNVGALSGSSVRYSGAPTWTTAAVSFQNGAAANVALVASSDSTLTYTLQAGSTLPTGISLQSAGYLAGTATGYSTTTSLSAVIIATDQEGQATQQTINITIGVNDAQFNYTTLLLSGETSSTPFIADASANNFGLTVAGDTRADTFSPYYGNGYYSTLFAGGGVTDSLAGPSNSAFAVGTGDITVECWLYQTSISNYPSIFQIGAINQSGSLAIFLDQTASNRITVRCGGSGGGNDTFFGASATATIPFNVWTHFALVRSSGNWTAYINGVKQTFYNNVSNSITLNTPYIGGGSGTGTWGGHISNLRVSNIALYSATFTVPTSPYTATANTLLLACQSNRFIDNSANAFAITPTGTPKVSPLIPFAASSSYATYGSAYFDGTGDYLSVPDSANLELGSSNFTIEFWINLSSSSGQSVILAHRASDVTNGPLAIFRPTGTTNLVLYLATGSSGWDIFSGSAIATVSVGQWAHVSICRSGSTFYSSINGVVSTLGTSASTVGEGASAWSIGGDLNNNYTNGYISDLRIIKGTALYTSSFTPPTAPLAAITNTQLLTCQYNGGANNSGIIDNSPFDTIITRNGNASQGTFSPYSQTGWSNYFTSGSSDYLTVGNTAVSLPTSTTPFTMEAWVYITAFTGISIMATNFSSGGIPFWLGLTNGTNTTTAAGAYPNMAFYSGTTWTYAAQATSSNMTALSLHTWYHIAGVFNGSTATVYVNGTAVVSNPVSAWQTTASAAGGINIGRKWDTSTSAYFSGFISNARLVIGTAVYTSNFTPSTTPLTAITNTTFLTCQSNRFQDNSTNNYAVTVGGTPKTQAFSPFAPGVAYTPSLHGGSAYFDGTGDYLTAPASTNYSFGSGAFTVEAWIYKTTAAIQGIASIQNASNGWTLRINADNTVQIFYPASSSVTTTGTVKLNAWTHVAAVRVANTVTVYINGVSAGSGSFGAETDSLSALAIGLERDGTNPFLGYISDLRVIKGTSVYTTNFTPPTSPLPNITATPAGLLLNFTNGGIVDAHSTTIMETVGGSQLRTATKKYGAASLSFSGSGQYLNVPAGNPTLQLLTGDFTVEFWMYGNSVSSTCSLVDNRNPDTANAGFDISLTSSVLRFTTSGTAFITGGTTLSNSTWYHVALTRSGNSFKLFLNGTQEGTTYSGSSTQNFTNSNFRIGSGANGAFNGYIDEVRITKGFARYTANFTAPTSQFLGQ